MAFNKDKALKEADKLLAKGKDKDAIALYREVVKNDPRDLNTHNKMGDLLQKVGDKAAAIEAFAAVAERYATDGFNLRAIAMYKKCQRVDATRIDFVEKLASLNAQQGLISEAKANYTQVAEHFLKEGKGARAREMYARIAEIEPDNLKNRLKLADLYLKDNQVREALGEYQVIGGELAKRGMLDEAVQVLEKALGIDPSNLQILRSLARTRVDAGKADEALQFVRARLEQKGNNDPDLLIVMGETFQAARNFDAARQCLDRALGVAPQRTDIRMAMFRLSLEVGDADAALAHHAPLGDALLATGKADQALEDMKAILRVRDGHAPTLERILQLLQASSAEPRATAEAMSRLADAYIAAGRNPEAERILGQLATLEPDVSQHGEKLEFVRMKIAQAGGAAASRPAAPEAAAPPAATSFAPAGGFAAPGSGDTSFGSLDLAEPESSSFAMSFDDADDDGDRGDDRAEFVAERTAEADVFIKYGLVDKAIDQLVGIVERYPDDIPTRQRLVGLYTDDGKQGQAVEQLMAIAEIETQAGNPGAATEALESARRIAPNHPALARAAGAPAAVAPAASGGLGDFSFGGDAEPEPAAAAPAAGGFELSLDSSGGGLGGFGFGGAEPEVESEPEAPAGFGLAAPEPEPAEAAASEFEVSLDADDGELSVSIEDEPAEQETAGDFDIEVDDDAEPAAAGFDLAPAETESAAEFEISMDAPEAAEPEPEPEPEPAPAAAAPPAAVAVPAAPVPSEAAESDEGLFGAEDDFFNFADELNKEMESDSLTEVSRDEDKMMSLEQIVSGIQKGVAAQVDREDYETHYNLGIAYKEMGLLDEAIAEFQYSSKDASRFLQCCILLGACFAEKGMPELAVTWYQKGKSAEGITEEDLVALEYEIATCKEALGDDDEALKSFMSIYAQNARYRDVAQRVTRLKQTTGR